MWGLYYLKKEDKLMRFYVNTNAQMVTTRFTVLPALGCLM